MKNVKAVMSENVNNRFVMVDRATGTTVDDNQGYGFETQQKAYAAYGWKAKHLRK